MNETETKVSEMFPRYVSEVFGSRIYSKRKENQLIDVLKLTIPCWENFFFYAKTLRECGFNDIDILLVTENAIATGVCCWETYNRDIFRTELRNVYKKGEHNKDRGVISTTTPNPFLVLDGVGIIKLFKSLIPAPKILDISDNPFVAAIQYRTLGMAVLPLNFRSCKREKCVKAGYCKHPDSSIRWSQYQEILPTASEMGKWEYNAGVCLVANDEWCFLDVDLEGIGLIDESMFKGHFECTPRGGYHFFAKAIHGLKSQKKDGIELKAKGTLIAACPTNRYIANTRR